MYHAITPEAVSVTLTHEGKPARCTNTPEGLETQARAAALVEYLLLTWMLTAKARHSGLLTLKMEAAANMVEGVFMFAGIKLKVTR